ncbi:CarD family transcriptional regulator [Aureimonas sp. Leaf454]|uniref:Crp/Fnr family transcriptional regulator n=1 Tax=Aureimonas sp. Leaf454 TaxID=1736381 RepID=UPI0006F6875F|nr:Crp/Fnr family transcriptional regulator [Aureimonas sp. Leaf454]KQT52339.1 CarD family transcriptional regulator [Aureimonas sp. Leaf454]
MSLQAGSTVRNVLLSTLSQTRLERLSPHLEPVELKVKDTLVEPDVPTGYVHFLESGLASMVAVSHDGTRQIEVGHIGWEGMVGLHVLHGSDRTPNRTFVQVAGSALRIPTPLFLKAMEDDWSMLASFLRFAHAYEIQLAQTALANGQYTINARLARWLLMYHDRVDGDEFPLTHEFLSLMLGVRRSGVTDQIHVLEGMGAVRASRASITVRDRTLLEEVAGGCYGLPEREYERLIGYPVWSPKFQPDPEPAGEPATA